MDNNTLQIKFQQRLNKLSSQDYDNIECWQIAEAFNKVQLEWTRRQLAGLNQRGVSDEGDKLIKEDLQVLISERPLTFTQYSEFAESELLPENYFVSKRIDATAVSSCCRSPRKLTVYPSQTGDVTVDLKNLHFSPSFEWAETFYTIASNRVRVYRDESFDFRHLSLTFYHKPRPISFAGCVSISTGQVLSDVTCEFRDDVVEVLIDEAAGVLAGDLENQLQMQRQKQAAAQNT